MSSTTPNTNIAHRPHPNSHQLLNPSKKSTIFTPSPSGPSNPANFTPEFSLLPPPIKPISYYSPSSSTPTPSPNATSHSNMLHERAQRLLEAEARRSLASALSPIPGPKALLVDPTLYVKRLSVASPLDLFTDPTFLREHGIRTVAPLSPQLDTTIPPVDPDIFAFPAIVFLIRGVNAAAARAAVTAIRAVREVARERTAEAGDAQPDTDSNEAAVKFLVLTTPRKSGIVDKIFRTTGLHDVPIAPLPLGFLPFDADLVTLDWPEAYRQVVLEGDNSALLASAAALSSLATTLNFEYATIRTAGAAATAVAEELLQTQGQMYPLGAGEGMSSPGSSVISSPLVGRSGGYVARDAFVALDEGTTAKKGGDIKGNGTDENEDEDEVNASTLLGAGHSAGRRRAVNLIIVDRGVDVVTPVLTQWTYEGLLEESVWLHNTMMDLPISTIASEDAMSILSNGPNASGTAGAVRKRLRGDVDPIFAELRDQNYWTAAKKISSLASSVQEYYKARPMRDTAEIAQVKEYVKGLKEKKSDHLSAAAHTAIASEISARTFDSYDFKRRFQLEKEMLEGSTATGRRVFIGDMIARGESLCHVLRLCCLWSVTSSGIDSEEFDFVRREILAIFGLGVLPLLANLERSGMFVRSVREQPQTNLPWIPFPNFGGSDTASVTGSISSMAGSDDSRQYKGRRTMGDYSWQFARAALRLVTDFDADRQVAPGSATAVAAPYYGYTPLSVRLVEAGLCDDGWGGLPQIVSHTSLLPPGHATVEHRRGVMSRSLAEGGEEAFDAVIVFVGGVARAEASAVRRAAESKGVRLLIATTAVMGPDDFVMSFDGLDPK